MKIIHRLLKISDDTNIKTRKKTIFRFSLSSACCPDLSFQLSILQFSSIWAFCIELSFQMLMLQFSSTWAFYYDRSIQKWYFRFSATWPFCFEIWIFWPDFSSTWAFYLDLSFQMIIFDSLQIKLSGVNLTIFFNLVFLPWSELSNVGFSIFYKLSTQMWILRFFTTWDFRFDLSFHMRIFKPVFFERTWAFHREQTFNSDAFPTH